MNIEEERKAEMTLVLICHKKKSAGARRDFCKEMGVDWDEYLYLKRKYRHLLAGYDAGKNGGNDGI